jgi:osmotically-inducible protein OsmY
MNHFDLPLDDKVHTALRCNPYLSGRSLRFETESGRVTLRGVVRSFFQKQMAQEALRHVEGINEIHNELEVAAG